MYYWPVRLKVPSRVRVVWDWLHSPSRCREFKITDIYTQPTTQLIFKQLCLLVRISKHRDVREKETFEIEIRREIRNLMFQK